VPTNSAIQSYLGLPDQSGKPGTRRSPVPDLRSLCPLRGRCWPGCLQERATSAAQGGPDLTHPPRGARPRSGTAAKRKQAARPAARSRSRPSEPSARREKLRGHPKASRVPPRFPPAPLPCPSGPPWCQRYRQSPGWCGTRRSCRPKTPAHAEARPRNVRPRHRNDGAGSGRLARNRQPAHAKTITSAYAGGKAAIGGPTPSDDLDIDT
jgi:hypothetical protein